MARVTTAEMDIGWTLDMGRFYKHLALQDFVPQATGYIVGAPAPDLQTTILYATGIATAAKTPAAAAALANATTADSAAAIIRKNGMEPF